MPDKITLLRRRGRGHDRSTPLRVGARLEFNGDGFTDETLRRDFSWVFTPLITEWEHRDLRL